MGPRLDHEPDRVVSFDGTDLAARRMGVDEGLPLLVVDAIGAGFVTWRKVMVLLADDHPLVNWDLRGLHDSSVPASDRIDAGAHAEDALSVLERYEVDRCAVVSWSSGTRIGLEIAHRYPDRVAALIMVCGGYGHPLRRLRFLEVASLLPTAAGVAKHFSGYLSGPLGAFVSRPELTGLVRQSGLIGPTADASVLVQTLREAGTCDLRLMLSIFEAVVGDAAPHLLPEIQPPTLLVAGERDPFTSLRMMEKMRRALPEARLTVYPKATHYVPIEFPERLAEDIDAFLAERFSWPVESREETGARGGGLH